MHRRPTLLRKKHKKGPPKKCHFEWRCEKRWFSCVIPFCYSCRLITTTGCVLCVWQGTKCIKVYYVLWQWQMNCSGWWFPGKENTSYLPVLFYLKACDQVWLTLYHSSQLWVLLPPQMTSVPLRGKKWLKFYVVVLRSFYKSRYLTLSLCALKQEFK